MVNIAGGWNMTSVWVLTVQLFQLHWMCGHFIMKYWEKNVCRSPEASLFVLFTLAPSLKSQVQVHLPESSNQSCEVGVLLT